MGIQDWFLGPTPLVKALSKPMGGALTGFGTDPLMNFMGADTDNALATKFMNKQDPQTQILFGLGGQSYPAMLRNRMQGQTKKW